MYQLDYFKLLKSLLSSEVQNLTNILLYDCLNADVFPAVTCYFWRKQVTARNSSA